MSIYKVSANEEKSQSFHFFTSAFDYMTCCIEEDINNEEGTKNHYELIQIIDDFKDVLLEYPGVELEIKDNNHPLLQKTLEEGLFNQMGFLEEINKKLFILDELENKKYTTIDSNKNILDRIKLVDVTEFCTVYCPVCKSLQHSTVEGCDSVILIGCEKCDNVTCMLHRDEV